MISGLLFFLFIHVFTSTLFSFRTPLFSLWSRHFKLIDFSTKLNLVYSYITIVLYTILYPVTKKLNTRDIQTNQHMNKYQTAISDSLKRKSNKRAENDMKYETHSQVSKEKAELFINLARVDSY